MIASCNKCVFWVRVGDGGNGWCHRFPPVYKPDPIHSEEWFIRVNAQDWCGEFRPHDFDIVEWPTQKTVDKSG